MVRHYKSKAEVSNKVQADLKGPSQAFRRCLLRGNRLYCSAGQTLKSGVKVDEGTEYKWRRMALWNVQMRAADSPHG